MTYSDQLLNYLSGITNEMPSLAEGVRPVDLPLMPWREDAVWLCSCGTIIRDNITFNYHEVELGHIIDGE